MIFLHIDVNDLKLVERQNWKNFDSAWLFDCKGHMFAKFILGGDKVGTHFFE